ncbi:MAG: hypothetical protein ACON4Z_04590, partial [Planctomycetota bacterium]
MHDLRPLRALAVRNGLNLFGLVDAVSFDRAQPPELRSAGVFPNCGSILVLGTGGARPSFEFCRQRGDLARPVDARTAELLVDASVRGIAHELGRLGIRARRLGPEHGRLSFESLGEAAGFGVVSPVSGMLLHPDFGPWLRVRAALLLEGAPFGDAPEASLPAHFKPCSGCDRPCVSACPPRAIAGDGSSDRRRCADYRFTGGCVDGCRARQACPVGVEHADLPGIPLHAHTLSDDA